MKTFILSTDFTHTLPIKKLIGKFGMEGYGRFMVLQELFARADNEEINLSLSDLNTLLHTKTKTLKPFLKHCQNILITFPEHSENIPETFWEHYENIIIMKPVKLLKSGDEKNSSLTSLTSNLTVNSNLTSLVKTTDKERQNKKDEPKLPYLDPTTITDLEKKVTINGEGNLSYPDELDLVENLFIRAGGILTKPSIKKELENIPKRINKRNVPVYMDIYRMLSGSRFKTNPYVETSKDTEINNSEIDSLNDTRYMFNPERYGVKEIREFESLLEPHSFEAISATLKEILPDLIKKSKIDGTTLKFSSTLHELRDKLNTKSILIDESANNLILDIL